MKRYMLQTAILAVFTASGLGELSAQESSGDPGSETLEYELLTQAEIETLVAPVALYPDTLLIQIFVAATQPFELVKADRFLLENSEVDAEALKPEIEAQGWDPSVEVLAIGFPDVIADMAQHIEWTEAMGDAMNAQTDDVMNAVQTLRQQAVNTGALVSGEQQTVDVDEDENIIVQPTDPEVVYVPQYDPVVVYEDSSSNLLTAAAVTFGSVLLIDAIFDDDDDWNGYWGCRNCGWGGGGIYPYPGGGIDIDVDGNVNIGNDINIGGGDRNRPGDGSWRPKPETRDEAREKISQKRDPGGDTKLPINKSDTNSDALRAKLSGRAGAPDISRPNASRRTGDAGGPQLQRPGNGASRDLPQVNRPSGQPSDIKRDAIAGTGTDRSRINGTSSVRSDSARPAQVTRPQQPKKPSAATGPSTKKKPTAIKKQGSGRQAAAASRRGGGKGGGARVGRR